ncbi:HlyD family efflux transporter periplasmic adaptor subunit [Steroidobacter flavus]|uniref:HlyD family efflux transporter periplasmic adaptor subunit n=1 Tax=Steroidobacter flavus TaxID=1842136 RepID=A0ABV8T2K6_9GAMM
MKLASESRLYRRVRVGLCVGLALVATIPFGSRWISKSEATAKAEFDPAASAQPRPVTAPGRIRPRDGIVTIAAPAAAVGVAIVGELHVSEGDWVERDQILAVSKGRDELEADLAASERRIDVAQAKLIALKSGGKREDIQALQAELQSEEASLAQIESDTRRAAQLNAERVVSDAALEAQRARLSVAKRVLEAKRARLQGLSSVRPADVAVAAAELSAAKADAESARTKLASQYVRAPSAGRVLRIHAYPGQAIGAEGLLSFAQTDEMFVDAEVVEHDIARIRTGQTARVTGDSLATPLEGTVDRIGFLVGAREVFAIDPTAFADSRIVHVLIRMKDPAAVERLINARVTVEIES